MDDSESSQFGCRTRCRAALALGLSLRPTPAGGSGWKLHRCERSISRVVAHRRALIIRFRPRRNCEKDESMIARISLLLLVSIVLFSSPAPNTFSAEAPQKRALVRMGLAARSTTSMPFFVAKERGFFREEGLDVELIVMQAIKRFRRRWGTARNSLPRPARPLVPLLEAPTSK